MRYGKFFTVSAVIFLHSTSVYAADLVVTFRNNTGEEHKGCVAIGYRSNGTKEQTGIHPVPPYGSFTFNVGQCSQFTHWRFIASLDYSDDPDNFDTVLMDTGKRPVTKCNYEITGNKK